MPNLTECLEAQYYNNFLPLIYSESDAEQMLQDHLGDTRVWQGSNGKMVFFLPPPPKIKDVPDAKPERLGKVIKRLAWCYRQDIEGKVALAHEVLQTLLETTE